RSVIHRQEGPVGIRRARRYRQHSAADKVAIANDGAPDSTSPKTGFESVLDGVVTVETDTAKGSGFFLTSGCLVITNEHVINGAETIIFRTSTRKLFVAQVLAVDTDRDLALLTSNARSCAPLSLEDTAKISVGQDVFAVGNPLELSGTVTKGIISAIRTTGGGIRLIQVDAAVNPGNSGGPLVSSSGKVLGVNTFKRKGSEGLNFAVASDEIKNAFGRFLR
ncbi:MAG: trypsin-like peptidase domain-containing protein, partial [Blastocatellia bacterium]|nr:trypsin-like peptidase domain-containing protein [Blastocatellia bacterium]